MKKSLLSVLLGIVITCVALWGYTAVKDYAFNKDIESKIIQSAKQVLVNQFPDIKIHSVMIEPSDDTVNFIYDDLFKAGVTYEKDKIIKRIEFNIGTYKGKILVPPDLLILQLDKHAPILFNKE